MELLLGFMVAAWLFTIGGVAYTTWRYVYAPWKVMRKDIAALSEAVEGVRGEMKHRKALYLPDDELARMESRAAVRRAMTRGLEE